MRINLAEDRTRLILSIGVAIAIHIAVLIVVGLNKIDYSYEPEFGPITVQISLDKQDKRVPEPVPEPEPVVQAATETVVESAPPPRKIAEPVATPVPKAVTVPKLAASPPPVVKSAEVDNSFIEAIKNRSRGNNEGLDARAVFGDDPVPAVSDSSNSAAASFFNDSTKDESAVVLSDVPASTRNSTVSEEPSDTEVPLVDRNVMRDLDRMLSSTEQQSGYQDTDTENASAATGDYISTADGSSHSVEFKDPVTSRKLLKWSKPVIPEDVQKAGISRYTVEIEFDIDMEGVTSSYRLVKTSGDSRVDAAVQSALRNWIFEESSDGVKKVRATLTYVIEIK